jgi:hypothetical protein
MEKIPFALESEGDWPPVGTERVWCERVASNYKLVNAPFFINGLAYGDVFEATPDPVNGHVFSFKIIEESGHSLVWALNNSTIDIDAFKKEILSTGCNFEGFQKFSLYAIDIPTKVNSHEISEILDRYEEQGLDLAFPIWRHGVDNT